MTTSDNNPEVQNKQPAQDKHFTNSHGLDQVEPYLVNHPRIGQEVHLRFMASMTIPEGISKQDTYQDALAEQIMSGTELIGFENDRDFDGLIDHMNNVLGKELLDRCLVSKIDYDPNHVLLRDDGRHYEIPTEEYPGLLAGNPELDNYRVRAFNTANRNLHPAAKRFQRMPIALYSFVGENLDTKDYLPEGVSDEERMKIYKLGTIVHEIAHSIHYYELTPEEWQAWGHINDQHVPFTAYAARYVGTDGWEKEQFSEAVRLYVTNRQYLDEVGAETARFLEAKFPTLQANGLLEQ